MAGVARVAGGVAPLRLRFASAEPGAVASDAEGPQVAQRIGAALRPRRDVVGVARRLPAPRRCAHGLPCDALGGEAAPCLGAVEIHAPLFAVQENMRTKSSQCLLNG